MSVTKIIQIKINNFSLGKHRSCLLSSVFPSSMTGVTVSTRIICNDSFEKTQVDVLCKLVDVTKPKHVNIVSLTTQQTN